MARRRLIPSWALVAVVVGVFASTDGGASWAVEITGFAAAPTEALSVTTIAGVPHVFAAREEDAYRALGWVVARDRLFQLYVQTLAASGRLTEIGGARVLPLVQ